MARVLIVEDISLIALDLKDMLEELGHEVVGMAATVEDALALAIELDPRPDFAMLDANLHGESAVPVAIGLRDQNIPFIVCSGYGEEFLSSLGMDGTRLVKPFDMTQLERAIAAIGSSIGH